MINKEILTKEQEEVLDRMGDELTIQQIEDIETEAVKEEYFSIYERSLIFNF